MAVRHERRRPTPAQNTHRQRTSDSFQLQNSILLPQECREGLVFQIVRPDGIDEWTRPLDDPEATLEAVAEVSIA